MGYGVIGSSIFCFCSIGGKTSLKLNLGLEGCCWYRLSGIYFCFHRSIVSYFSYNFFILRSARTFILQVSSSSSLLLIPHREMMGRGCCCDSSILIRLFFLYLLTLWIGWGRRILLMFGIDLDLWFDNLAWKCFCIKYENLTI